MSSYNGVRIIVEEVFPPIPTRHFDFVAYLDGREEGGPHCFGASRYVAICELIQELWEAGE